MFTKLAILTFFSDRSGLLWSIAAHAATVVFMLMLLGLIVYASNMFRKNQFEHASFFFFSFSVTNYYKSYH